jgi:hypothetical protein
MKGRTNMKARLGIATAVLVGGGAIGVAVVASGNHSGTANAQSAAYSINFHHTISEGTALSTAISELQGSESKAISTLAQMAPMSTYSEVWAGWHHKTEYAAQRGIVVLATKKFLIVKSSKGSLHLWWLKGAKFANVSSSATGMTALTGSNTAAKAAMVSNNMTPAAVTVAGSTTVVSQMTAPVAKPTTLTISTGTETITITITPSTATVTTPTATPTATATVAPTATPSASPTTQSVWTRTDGVARGDLVFIAGEREHGQLIAKLVLFAAPTTTTTPTASPSAIVTPSPSSTITGTHS